MEVSRLAGDFSWYRLSAPGACPPKSMFMLLLIFTAVTLVPILGLWYLQLYLVVTWLACALALLLVCLLFDVLNTYRRYKAWSAQWLCARCHADFPFSMAIRAENAWHRAKSI